jgi:hypothetical protein
MGPPAGDRRSTVQRRVLRRYGESAQARMRVWRKLCCAEILNKQYRVAEIRDPLAFSGVFHRQPFEPAGGRKRSSRRPSEVLPYGDQNPRPNGSDQKRRPHLRPRQRDTHASIHRPLQRLRIQGVQHYLWRAVDQDGVVLDIFVQPRRDGNAAKRFFIRLLKGLQ